MKESVTHISVLLHETIEGLLLKQSDVVLDATLGGGGHSYEALMRLGSQGTLIALDADKAALDRSRGKLEQLAVSRGVKLVLKQSNFRHISHILDECGVPVVDKYMFDLGLSSQELEESGRGFTFKKDEPLLMTFASEVDDTTLTAREIVNTWDEENIATIIKAYGEERYARRIARGIVSARSQAPIHTTFQLVDIILSATPASYHHAGIHPATRTFQALRMTVNDEVRALGEALVQAYDRLAPHGRIAVISFHSIEDRIVKNFFREQVKQHKALGITKKPIIPSEDEIAKNPRSRSAKLRIIEKI